MVSNDALDSFTTLLECVPGWIADLEDILKSASKRQNEFQAAAEGCHTSNRAPKRKLSKSSSMQSKRSKSPSLERDGSLLRKLSRPLANARAQKSSPPRHSAASEKSGEQSGPAKSRMRNTNPIYYDSELQKKFEHLVRGIGSSRNAIRKGKMSAKVDALSRTGSSGSDSSSTSADFSPVTAKLHFKSSRPRSRDIIGLGRDDESIVFDRIDTRLEKAQVMCERAAHRMLRDGECVLEITSAKELFATSLTMAEAELPALRRRAEKAAERRRKSEERQRADEELQQQNKKSTEVSVDAKNFGFVIPAFPSDGNLEVDELEVDNADDDSGDEMPEFDIKALQMGKYSPYHQSRMQARAQ